jgi:hypothetical protein
MVEATGTTSTISIGRAVGARRIGAEKIARQQI